MLVEGGEANNTNDSSPQAPALSEAEWVEQ